MQRAPGPNRMAILAASLLIALGSVIVYQEGRIRELSSPRPLAVLTLRPEGEFSRGGAEVDQELAAETPATIILPSLDEPGDFPSYTVRVIDRAGQLRWSFPAQERDVNGAINLYFPEGLPEGDYQIRLVGVDGYRIETLESYRVSSRLRGP